MKIPIEVALSFVGPRLTFSADGNAHLAVLKKIHPLWALNHVELGRGLRKVEKKLRRAAPQLFTLEFTLKYGALSRNNTEENRLAFLLETTALLGKEITI